MPDPQSPPSHEPLASSVRGALVVGLFCLFLLVLPHGRGSVDEEFIYRTTYGLVHRGSLRFAPLDRPIDADVPWEQQVASKFGVLPSLAAVPFHLLGLVLSAAAPAGLGDDVLRTVTYSSSGLWMALAALQLAAALAALGFSRKVQATTALLFALATPAIVYARFFHVAAMATLLMTALLHAAVRFELTPDRRRAAWLGVWLGLLLLVGFNFVVLLPVVVLFVAGVRTQRRLASTVAVTAPVLAGWATAIGVNLLRGHDWFRGGYFGESFVTPLSIGLYGLLLGAGRGLLLYSPISAVGILLLPSFWRRHRRLSWLLASIFVLITVSYAKWFAWNGGMYWGPRYLVPLVPLTLLPLACYLARWDEKPLIGKTAFAALIVVALAVQWRGVSTHYFAAMGQIAPLSASENEQLFVPHLQPLWWQADTPSGFLWENWHGRGHEGLALGTALVLAIVALTSLFYAGAAGGLFGSWHRALPPAGWAWLVAALAAIASWHTWRGAGHGLLRETQHAGSLSHNIDFGQPRWRWRSPHPGVTTWTGYLRVPQNGDYRLFLHSTGAGRFIVNQQSGPQIPRPPRIDHTPATTPWSLWSGRLNVGLYRIEIAAQPGPDDHAAVSLLWTVHGDGIDRRPIAPQYLYPTAPTRIRLLLDRAMGMAWLALVWAALVVMGGREGGNHSVPSHRPGHPGTKAGNDPA